MNTSKKSGVLRVMDKDSAGVLVLELEHLELFDKDGNALLAGRGRNERTGASSFYGVALDPGGRVVALEAGMPSMQDATAACHRARALGYWGVWYLNHRDTLKSLGWST